MSDTYAGKRRDNHPSAIRLGQRRDFLSLERPYSPGKHRDRSIAALVRNALAVDAEQATR